MLQIVDFVFWLLERPCYSWPCCSVPELMCTSRVSAKAGHARPGRSPRTLRLEQQGTDTERHQSAASMKPRGLLFDGDCSTAMSSMGRNTGSRIAFVADEDKRQELERLYGDVPVSYDPHEAFAMRPSSGSPYQPGPAHGNPPSRTGIQLGPRRIAVARRGDPASYPLFVV